MASKNQEIQSVVKKWQCGLFWWMSRGYLVDIFFLKCRKHVLTCANGEPVGICARRRRVGAACAERIDLVEPRHADYSCCPTHPSLFIVNKWSATKRNEWNISPKLKADLVVRPLYSGLLMYSTRAQLRLQTCLNQICSCAFSTPKFIHPLRFSYAECFRNREA